MSDLHTRTKEYEQRMGVSTYLHFARIEYFVTAKEVFMGWSSRNCWESY